MLRIPSHKMPINPLCCERARETAEKRLVERMLPFLEAHIRKDGVTKDVADLVKGLITVNGGFAELFDILFEVRGEL